MDITSPDDDGVTRRDVARLLAFGAVLAGGSLLGAPSLAQGRPMAITCFIRYQIDPFQREAFKTYATNWTKIIPRCGGNLLGYFLPHEGTNDIGWGLISLESLAAYEAYRVRLRNDPEARQNFALAQEKKFVLREERSFLENV